MNEGPSLPPVRKARISIVELVNLLGSVASITGISLLWLSQLHSDWRELLLIDIPAFAVAASLILGGLLLITVALTTADRKFFVGKGRIRLAYYLLATPIAIGLVIAWGFVAFGLIGAFIKLVLK